MLFATLYLPNFQLQAALRQAVFIDQGRAAETRATALVGNEKKPVVLQLNEAAQKQGVHRGMSPSQALARSLGLLLVSPQPEQETALQEIVLEQAFTLSPYVEATAPGIATVQFMDARNRENEIFQVIEHFKTCGISARAGLGPTPDISFLAAHLAAPILQVTDASEFLAPLPLEVLLETSGGAVGRTSDA